MVNDRHRTPALVRAVNRVVQQGDTVLDIGTGLGVLAIAAAKAGAKQVIALDVDAAALREAKKRANDAGVVDRIEFRRELSFETTLSQRADIILCETVGSFAFDENILATLRDAKKRLLKRGGKIVPAELELHAAPIDYLPKLELPAEIAIVRPQHLLAKPVCLARIDFCGTIPETIHIKDRFSITRNGTACAVAVWPRAIWHGREISDASPLQAATHWKQGILELEPRIVHVRERLGIEIIIGPHPEDPRLMTERLWRWSDKR